MEETSTAIPTRERGFALTIFLILMLVANLFIIIFYLSNISMIKRVLHIPEEMVFVLAALSLINFSFVVAIWKWKQWGIYAFYTMSVIVVIINLIMGLGVVQSLTGLTASIILWWLTREKEFDKSPTTTS